jgi:hypothetical protein
MEGPSTLSSLHKEALLTYLGIPTELPSMGPATLRTAFYKYNIIIKAMKSMTKLGNNKAWIQHLEDSGVEPGWAPVYVDLINMFIAKSQFYSGWQGSFIRVTIYPGMKAWLEDSPDSPSEEDVWNGIVKTEDHYNYVDLAKWADKMEALKLGKKPVPVAIAVAKKAGSSKKHKRRKSKKEESSEVDSERDERKKSKKSKKSKRRSE